MSESIEWIKKILSNNKKQVSIIHFVKSTEFSRPIQLLLSLQKAFDHHMIFDAWNGLRDITFKEIEDRETGEKITVTSEAPTGGEFDEVTTPINAMQAIFRTIRQKKTLAIVEHFDTLTERIGGIPDLNDALRYIIRQYDAFPKTFQESMVVLFVEDTSQIAKDVLNHTLLYTVSGSSSYERKIILRDAIKQVSDKGGWTPENVDENGIVEAGAGLTLNQFNTALVLGFAAKNVTPKYISSAKQLQLEMSGVGKITTPENALDPAKIGGYEDVKKILSLGAAKVTDWERANELGCGSLRGVLQIGPPGTGKSLFAKAMARLTNRPVVEVRPSDVFSKWYGESIAPEENVFAYDYEDQNFALISAENLYKKLKTKKMGAISFTKQYAVKVSPIMDRFKHRSKSRFFKIITKSGRNITVTEDHSLFTMSEGGAIIPVAARDLKEGGYILTPGKINLPEHLHPVSSDFGKLIGLWVAEGIHNQNSDVREFIKKSLKRAGYKFHTTDKLIGIPSTLTQQFIGWCNTGAENKKIPNWLFNAPIDVVKSFLSGYYSGDGWVSKVGNNAVHVGASTTSLELVQGISVLFLRLGIPIKVREKREWNGNTSYFIEIYGKDYVKRFQDEIGFIQKDQNEKLENLISNVKWGRTIQIPVIPIMREWMNKYPYKAWKKSKTIGIEILRNLLDENDPDHSLKALWSIINEETRLDKVKSITQAKDHTFSYDFSVNPTENFVAGQGGIFAHNSAAKIGRIIRLCEEINAILFIDEIESMVGGRGSGSQAGQHEETARTLGELLNYLGDYERKAIIVGNTNRPDKLDSAMMRPGRFGLILYIGLPDAEARRAIFDVHINNPIDHPKVKVARGVTQHMDEIIEQTKCFTGAEIAQVVRDACVKPDTIILGDNKKIHQYNVGENVFGMGSTKNSIKKKFIRNFEGEIVKIKPKYLLPIEVTPEHPVLTAPIEIYNPRKDEIPQYGSKTIRKVGSFQWKLAKDIEKGDGIIIPRLEGVCNQKILSLKPFLKNHSAVKSALKTGLPLDEQVAWVMGLYVAEGSVAHRSCKNIKFSLGITEEKLANRIKKIFSERFGYRFYEEVREDIHTRYLTIYTTVLGRAFTEWFGRGAKNKKIPDFILLHKDKNISKAFLRGFLDGDGCISKTRDEITLSTSSRLLALQIQLTLARFGILMGIGINKLKPRKIRERLLPEGLIFNLKSRREEVFDFFEIKRERSYRKRKDYHVFDKYITTMISKVSRIPYSGKVYNLATENNTYLVSNGVVHNCDFAFEDNAKTVGIDHFREAIAVNRPNMEERKDMIKQYDYWARLYCRGMRRKGQVDEAPPELVEEAAEVKGNLGRFRM